MRGTKLIQSVMLVGLASGMVAAIGCESSAEKAAERADHQAANDGYMSNGTHGVGSAGTALPDSPIGATPASPNTNGIRRSTHS